MKQNNNGTIVSRAPLVLCVLLSMVSVYQSNQIVQIDSRHGTESTSLRNDLNQAHITIGRLSNENRELLKAVKQLKQSLKDLNHENSKVSSRVMLLNAAVEALHNALENDRQDNEQAIKLILDALSVHQYELNAIASGV